MKRVLILANDDIWLYKLRKELIQALLQQGYKVAISMPFGEMVKNLTEWGCEFIESDVDRRGTNPIKDMRLLTQYINILRKYQPDVVLTFNIKPNLYGGLASRLMGIPCINNITGLGSGFNRQGVLRNFLIFMYKISLKKAYCVFFQNSSDLQSFLNRKIIEGRHELLPGSGVNLEEFALTDYPDERTITFNFIGRIMYDKGIDQYLEAARIIKNKYLATQFNIIGFVEPTQSHYEVKIQEYERKGYVKYLGFQEDVRPFIAQAHCIIQPSYSEGLSNVLLENAAMGRALIASDIPGCREVIDEGMSGYTFKAGNTESLVEKLERFINLSHEMKVSMGMRSREKVETEFSRNLVNKSYMNIIHRVMK